ncbi:hypothetical protein EIN_391080 [Entamoeba invadens IP1]|uniref:Uncharacterized protein n=2 Tax=Entamoeba invadens TaxID=33085 RepID=A0A0A1U8Q7_ENTIV|nr:hypothetical protein EIN_391080 [Entamoeba invadens IP1]ELP89473.1 hypothetical protein EIN_391080 [Entamoeba invadens IP1]BAN41798.1 hypothetical protein [Entamoeba invadens]|eukprot:XP_004256244.1 hypothetical protein EIN_391080 [Entamoeba invadens IP1]
MQDKPNLQCSCCLCQKSRLFQLANPKIKTTKLCVLILKSLKMLHPELECFSIKTDIADFIKDHWGLLIKLKLFQSVQYKKSLLDALNHCPQIECGKDFCHDRGYYRLKEGSSAKDKSDDKDELLPKIKTPKQEKECVVGSAKNEIQNLTLNAPPQRGGENSVEEKLEVSKELYSCYDDLQRQVNQGVKVFSCLYGKYLANLDVKRSDLVRDILEHQTELFHLFGKRKMEWCTFN